MARVKRSVHAKKKRREVLEKAKGYTGTRRKRYRAAKEQVMHSGNYAYRDRRDRKAQFRRLWITRINAAVRPHGISYSRVHQRAEGRRHRDRSQDPGRHGRQRPEGVRRSWSTRPRPLTPPPDERPGEGSVLTSAKNPKVAAASRLKKRAYRDEDRRFLVEGAQAVSEALGVPGRLETLFTDDELDPLAVRAAPGGRRGPPGRRRSDPRT